MTRSSRRALLFLAALVALAGLAFWDAHRRAWKAIERHERRIAGEAAALRARHAQAPIHSVREEVPFISRTLEDVLGLGEAGAVDAFEGGWTGSGAWVLRDAVYDAGPQSPESVLDQLSAVHNTFRAGGFEILHALQTFESGVLNGWRATLEQECPDVAPLRSVAVGLDRLAASRPLFKDFVTGEHLLQCRAILSVLREKDDPHRLFPKGPGPGCFFSWKVLVAQTLNEKTWSHQALQDYLAQSPRDPVEFVGAYEEAHVYWKSDAALLNSWGLARTATAVAGYEREHGRFPERLEELVPSWLPSAPRCTWTCRPLGYKNGSVTVGETNIPGGYQEWKVKRR